MENFVRLLKKTIDAQKNVTPQLRQLIYARARVTIEKKLAQSNVSEEVANNQKELLENAIVHVEESYLKQETSQTTAHTADKVIETKDSTYTNKLTTSGEPIPSVTNQIPSHITNNTYDNHHLNDPSSNEDTAKMPQDTMPTESIEKTNESKNKQKDDAAFERLGDILKPQAERKALAAVKKKRLIFSLLVLILILLIGSAAYFIFRPFEQSTKDVPEEGKSGETQTTQTEKLAYKLNPDGTETLVAPLSPQEDNNLGKTTAEATPKDVNKTNFALATLYLTQSANQTEKIQTGDVEWVEARDISDSGADLGPIIRGSVSIPVNVNGEKFIARMTVHPNRDETIPATYITDLIFVTPDGYSEGPVEKILDLRFKPTEQMPGQQLSGITYETIGDNFFLLPMSSAGPFADNNLRLMRQMPWIRIVAQLKSGRIIELTLNKGEKGTEVFNQVIGEWLGEKSSTPTAPSIN